jgi:CBS domain-containing protein
MDEHELDRIVVVEDDRLVGIISEADIRSDEGPISGVTDTVRGATDRLLGGGKEKQR